MEVTNETAAGVLPHGSTVVLHVVGSENQVGPLHRDARLLGLDKNGYLRCAFFQCPTGGGNRYWETSMIAAWGPRSLETDTAKVVDVHRATITTVSSVCLLGRVARGNLPVGIGIAKLITPRRWRLGELGMDDDHRVVRLRRAMTVSLGSLPQLIELLRAGRRAQPRCK